MTASGPALLPRPRRITPLPGAGASKDAAIEVQQRAGLGGEAFTLHTGGPAVRIAHGGASGLRYAKQCLAQLQSHAGARLPALAIEDAPDFPVRGYLLDVSRDRVPTRESLALLVERLALFRINHLQLYTEHTFAYRGHEEVWRNASPLDAGDVKWLDGQCRAAGIELCANQNTFGHMGRWLKLPRYRARAEAPQGVQTRAAGTLAPATLAPNESNANFALSLCRELLAQHHSRRINIGCDETFELGRGASQQAVRARGRAHVFVEHLQRLLRGLHADGCEVLFWGDMLRDHPDCLRALPQRDCIALAWHYEAPDLQAALPAALRALFEELGVSISPQQLRGFEGHVQAFAESGVPFWVCPGTSTWNALIGRLDNARGNLLDAAETGLAHGARGYLVTDWGDNGHMQPPAVSLPPLAYGAAVAWCCAANRDLEVAPLLDRFVFRDQAGIIGGVLDELGRLHARTGQRVYNGSPLFTELTGAGRRGRTGDADGDGIAAVIQQLNEARAALSGARPACADGEIIVREVQQAARLARHGAWRMARAAGFARPADFELRADLEAAIAEQRECWLARSRPGGLSDSLARLQKVLREYAA